MNIKKEKNSQLSTTESKKQSKTKKQTQQTTRTGTESQIWRSFGGLLAGKGKGEKGGKHAGIKKYKLVSIKQTGGC